MLVLLESLALLKVNYLAFIMRDHYRFYSVFFLIFFIFSGLDAQDENEVPDLVTDRPDQTESSISVPHKTLQIETGFSGGAVPSGPDWLYGVEYASTLLRYGLFDGMELRLGIAYNTMESTMVAEFETIVDRGMSPLALGTKINLTEQNGWMPEMAVIVHVNIPVFESDFAIDHAIPDIILAASHSISPKFSLGYNLGIEWADTDESPIKKYSVVAGFSLAERIGLFVETFGSFGDGDFVNMIDGGFTFLILPNLQYDISGGIGTTAVSPIFFIGTGLSFRLP